MYSQENASDSVLFSSVAGLRVYSLQKRDSILDVFCEILKFYRIYILRQLGDYF